MLDFFLSNGYVPALDENLDRSILGKNEYSIKEFDNSTLSYPFALSDFSSLLRSDFYRYHFHTDIARRCAPQGYFLLLGADCNACLGVIYFDFIFMLISTLGAYPKSTSFSQVRFSCRRVNVYIVTIFMLMSPLGAHPKGTSFCQA